MVIDHTPMTTLTMVFLLRIFFQNFFLMKILFKPFKLDFKQIKNFKVLTLRLTACPLNTGAKYNLSMDKP